MLNINFAETFAPEKVFLSRLLMLIAQNREPMTVDEISERTGIPQGAHSGKVGPHLKYLIGMGLIESNGDKWYSLTPFGRAVYDMDMEFSEPLTAWACHAFMCDPKVGSPVYSEVNKLMPPGSDMNRESIEERAVSNLDISSEVRCFGPLFSMYTNEQSFGKQEILTSLGNNHYIFNSAPENLMFLPLYGAFICHWFNSNFSDRGQISIEEFNAVSGFGRIFGKKEYEVKNIFSKIAGLGYVKISNLVDPPVFSVIMGEDEAWESMYSNMF